MSEALDEQRRVVLALAVVAVEQVVDIQQVVDEVRTPAKHERYTQHMRPTPYNFAHLVIIIITSYRPGAARRYAPSRYWVSCDLVL